MLETRPQQVQHTSCRTWKRLARSLAPSQHHVIIQELVDPKTDTTKGLSVSNSFRKRQFQALPDDNSQGKKFRQYSSDNSEVGLASREWPQSEP